MSCYAMQGPADASALSISQRHIRHAYSDGAGTNAEPIKPHRSASSSFFCVSAMPNGVASRAATLTRVSPALVRTAWASATLLGCTGFAAGMVYVSLCCAGLCVKGLLHQQWGDEYIDTAFCVRS